MLSLRNTGQRWKRMPGELDKAIQEHREYIKQQTLAVSLKKGDPGPDAVETVIDGMKFRFSVVKKQDR